MEFFNSAVDVLKTLVVALGAGLGVWGAVNLMEGDVYKRQVEIQKTGIKDFDRYAKRYHIDYSIQKDLSCTPPR